MSMSKILIGSSLLLALNIASHAQELGNNVNPVLRKHAENITFYLNFDEDNQLPVMAKSQKNIKSQEGVATFEKGLWGKCLRTGHTNYYAEGNLDLSAPGTLIMWVSPWKWKQTEKEDYFWPFMAVTDASKIQLGRQGGAWGKTRIYAYVTVFNGKTNIYHGIEGGSGKNWKNGEWHMLVLAWTPENIAISVDGGKLAEKGIPQPLGNKTEWFCIGAAVTEKQTQVLQDEVIILNTKLNDDEIKSLYEETLKAAGK